MMSLEERKDYSIINRKMAKAEKTLWDIAKLIATTVDDSEGLPETILDMIVANDGAVTQDHVNKWARDAQV